MTVKALIAYLRKNQMGCLVLNVEGEPEFVVRPFVRVRATRTPSVSPRIPTAEESMEDIDETDDDQAPVLSTPIARGASFDSWDAMMEEVGEYGVKGVPEEPQFQFEPVDDTENIQSS